MKPEVQDAFWAWLAGVGIGALPLIAHFIAEVGFRPTPDGEDASWVIDILFMTISVAGMSLVSVVARPSGSEIIRGRAGPALTALLVIFLVCVSMLYGAEASSNGRGYAMYLAIGFLLGTAGVALFFDMTVAAKAAT